MATLQLRRIPAMRTLGNRVVASRAPVRVRREVLLPAPPDRVWAALTAEISEWFGADVDIDLRPGGSAAFRWAEGRERAAVVEEIHAGGRLVFRWLPFERSSAGGIRAAEPGRVEFELETAEGGTRLSVTEVGLGAALRATART
jgi:uncharacterized protein YndB with AHSA1/START domain